MLTFFVCEALNLEYLVTYLIFLPVIIILFSLYLSGNGKNLQSTFPILQVILTLMVDFKVKP